MKRIIPIFIALFLLTACGNALPDFENRVVHSQLKEGVTELTGVIEPLELDIHQAGTHQIRTEEGDLFLIQSQVINLSRYFEKTVIITGKVTQSLGNAKPVFDVAEVKIANEGGQGIKTYQNESAGFELSYSKAWELIDAGDKILLDSNGLTVVVITIFPAENWTALVSDREGTEGVSVTVGGQNALRYNKGSSIEFYVPNTAKQTVYHIRFNTTDHSAETDLFYELIDSFKPLYFQKPTGKRCGGPAKLECDEGFRCELSSTEKDVAGVCVSLDETNTVTACPFVPLPTDCIKYEATDFGKNGCPMRYDCLDAKQEGVTPENTVTESKRVIDTITKYQNNLFSGSPQSLDQFDVDETEKLVTVIYQKNDGKRKIIFGYTPSGNEFNFIPQAGYVQKNGAWISEKDGTVQKEDSVTPSTPSAAEQGNDEPESIIPPKTEDMRVYENSFKEFSVRYPKNWYFRSFGALNNTLWFVGFSDHELENEADTLISLSLLSETEKPSSAGYTVTVKRDEKTVFVLRGAETFKEVIDLMATSLSGF
ncbi:hypothetical protein COY07_03645 [Candidatus Peregrinibacteria bacterium CG_4_10_14_0_2_um_filter_43_11]|nr:MAG: hypothetical protein COY07_03645 [Candidatus Peregrinibacteria bacterium CG_4_10_14_0_2_um_filter_43_11]